jgi:hypothetical protein
LAVVVAVGDEVAGMLVFTVGSGTTALADGEGVVFDGLGEDDGD